MKIYSKTADSHLKLKQLKLKHLKSWHLKSCLVALLLAVLSQDSASAAAKAEAFAGHPFGVGRVTIDVLRGEPLLPLSDERFTVMQANGRVLYPVLKQEPVRGLIRGLLDIEAPRKVTVYFLFQGDQPFDLSAFTPNEQGVRIRPLADQSSHQRLVADWWSAYTKRYQALLSGGEYPPVAENFLVASLSRRLKLSVPKPRRKLFGSNLDLSLIHI